MSSKQPQWCVFYAHGGIDGTNFCMSIQRADTAEEAAAMAASEYGGEADRWVVPREHVRKFSMEQVWRPEEYAVRAEEGVL